MVLTAHEILFQRVEEELKDVSDKPIIRYLTSSFKWGEMVDGRFSATYGISLKVLGYSGTRWYSLQMLLASLLRIRTAIRTFTSEHMYDDNFPEASLLKC
jgi:hypothetical protein